MNSTECLRGVSIYIRFGGYSSAKQGVVHRSSLAPNRGTSENAYFVDRRRRRGLKTVSLTVPAMSVEHTVDATRKFKYTQEISPKTSGNVRDKGTVPSDAPDCKSFLGIGLSGLWQS